MAYATQDFQLQDILVLISRPDLEIDMNIRDMIFQNNRKTYKYVTKEQPISYIWQF